MGMILNRNLTPEEQIPLLRATEDLLGPECEPKHKMFSATIWAPDGSFELASGCFRSFWEARSWAMAELSAKMREGDVKNRRNWPWLEAEFEVFKASTHDWIMFDQDPSGAQRFRDATVSLEDDPRFQSAIRIRTDGSFEEE